LGESAIRSVHERCYFWQKIDDEVKGLSNRTGKRYRHRIEKALAKKAPRPRAEQVRRDRAKWQSVAQSGGDCRPCPTKIYAKGAHRRLPSAKPLLLNSSLCVVSSARLIRVSAARRPLPYTLVDDDAAMESDSAMKSICGHELMVDDNATTSPASKEDLVNIAVVSMANRLCNTE
jgi:hypothetical protein